jgi:hypothetical protein
MNEMELLMEAVNRGFEQGRPDQTQWAWYRGGEQVSPAYAEWDELMGWMRDEIAKEPSSSPTAG